MTKILLFFLLVVAAIPPVLAGEYPTPITIHDFRAVQAISKPGDQVKFQVAFTPGAGHDSNKSPDLRMELWIERELDPAFLAAQTDLPSTPHKRQEATLTWVADKDVFGHRAWIKFVDVQGRILATAETLFDVTSNWINVMRLSTGGANRLAYEGYSNEQMNEDIQRMRDAYFNAREVYTFSPAPYELAPKEVTWPYQYAKPNTPPISKERLQTWGKRLHAEGMKFVAYNETSAAFGPDDWKVYLKPGDKKPYAHYFEDKGMFTPNALKIAPLFASQLEESIRMFGWDGILMDSAIACFINTSQGFDQDGRRLTRLSAGEVGYQHLHEARKRALAANADFRFLVQNATSVSHVGVKESTDNVYPWIVKNAERMHMAKCSEVADFYTAEIDAYNEPRDGRYPLTYEQMSVSLNSLVETLGRPLMAWAHLVEPENYSAASVAPYMAIHLASRTQVHDHFDAYGGGLSEGANSPASQQFLQYQRFLARYSYYLHDPKLQWIMDAEKHLSVSSEKPLFWKRTVYRRPLENGGERIVLNILNLPSNGKILHQKEIPETAQNVTLRLGQGVHPSRVVFLNADDPSLTSLTLKPGEGGKEGTEFRLPPIPRWAVVVIETAPSADSSGDPPPLTALKLF